MKLKEKWKKLSRYEEKDQLTEIDYKWLSRMAKDSDDLVRSEIASVPVLCAGFIGRGSVYRTNTGMFK